MALLGIVGVIVGLIAHLVLRQDGYSIFGEIMLGVLGAVVLGLFAGILYGMRQITPETVAASAVGSGLVLGVVAVLTLRTRGGQTKVEAPSASAPARQE